MNNKLDIDKYIKDYKDSLPNIHHTEAEDITLMNTILSKVSTEISTIENNTIENSIGKVVDFIKSLIQKDGYRYSYGVLTLVVGVGIYLLYNYTTSNVVAPSQQIAKKQPVEYTKPEPQYSNGKHANETTLLASIDCDAYRRGGESPIDQNVIYGIIGKQLKKLDIKYQLTTNLITQPLNTDSTIVIVIFTYDQAKKSVEITSVSQKTDTANSKSININMLIKEIKTTLQHKVRMLYE